MVEFFFVYYVITLVPYYGDILPSLKFIINFPLSFLYWWTATGRSLLLEARNTSSTAVNSTSFDESKIYVVLCFSGRCNYFGHGFQDCYCCGDGYGKANCHQTMKECKAKCPGCCSHPSSSQPPSMQSATDSTTNTTEIIYSLRHIYVIFIWRLRQSFWLACSVN